MKTNDLKKGSKILLCNGWTGTLEDNKKGNARLARVKGEFFTDLGSVYGHDIIAFDDNGKWNKSIELTTAQLKAQALNRKLGFGYAPKAGLLESL